MSGEGEWKRKKHGAEYRRQRRKVHFGIDASTLEIRAMEVTDNSIGDALVLPRLLDQIPVHEKIASVSGDGAYDTKDCHKATALRAAHTIIPTPNNPKPLKMNRCGAAARNDILRETRRLRRASWKRWSSYHCRSLVETKTRYFKLMGERVIVRDVDRQVAELQVRAALLNRSTRLGPGPRSRCYKTCYE